MSVLDDKEKAPKTKISKQTNGPSNSSETPGETLSPLTTPPGSSDRPPAPGTTGQPKTEEGLPVLQPLGFKTKELFLEDLRDSDDRLDRLENAVQELRNDFDSMSPAIVRLISVESDIQDLIGQLETLLQHETYNPPKPLVAPDPVPLPASQPPPAAQPQTAPIAQGQSAAPLPITPQNAYPAGAPVPLSANAGGVYDMRIGQHPDKIRIVLDVDKAPIYRYDIDNNERLFIVELPDTAWNAMREKTFPASSLLDSYRVESLADRPGSLLILQLKSAASVLFEGVLPSVSGSGQRIVFDLTARS